MIADHDIYLFTKPDFLKKKKKKFGCPNLGPMGQNQAQNEAFFAIFLSLDHAFYLNLYTMIACDNI